MREIGLELGEIGENEIERWRREGERGENEIKR